MNKHTGFIILFSFSAVLLGSVQYTSAQPVEDLLRQATENNVELKALQNEYLAALEKAPQVSELPDPEFGVGVSILPVETRLGPQWLRVSGTQMFPWMGTLKARKDVSLTMAKTKYEKINAVRLNLWYEVKTAYYQLYLLDKSQDIISRNIRIYRILERIALSGVEAGKGTLADVLRVQIKIRELETDRELLENKKQKPLANLNKVLSRPPDAAIQVSDSLELAIIPYKKDSLFRQIPEQHPMFAMLNSQQLASQKALDLNRLNGKPSFGFGVDYILVGKRSDADPPGNGRDILMPRASIKIPVYRKKYGAKEREEELMIAAVENQKLDLKYSYQSMIQMAYSESTDAEIKIELYARQIETINSAIEILQSSYSSSGRNFDELLRLQSDLVNYDLKILEAIVQSHMAMASIERFVF